MLTIEYNKDLSSLNTFSMKVSCACYVEYDSLEDLFKIDLQFLVQIMLFIMLLLIEKIPGLNQ